MKKTQFLILFMLLLLLLGGCSAYPWEHQDRIFVRLPFEASGDSRLLPVAPVVYDATGDVFIPLVREGGEDPRIYELSIGDEKVGEILLADQANLVLPGAFFEAGETVDLLFSTKEEEGELVPKRLLRLHAQKVYAVDEKQKQDPLSTVEAFIRLSFSLNSKLLPTDLIHERSEPFFESILWRQKITQMRRGAMGNEKLLTSLSPEESSVDVSGDLAFVYYKSREEFYYYDEADFPATILARYFFVLAEEEGEWTVLWATRQGTGDVAGFFGRRVGAFALPFLRYGEEGLIDVRAANYSKEVLLEELNRYEYKDFEAEYAREERNLQEELAAESQGIPESSPDLLPIDREGIQDYLLKYALMRNDAWEDFTLYGGNCQNFASQVLYAGGAPMVSGVYPWYYYSLSERTGSWSAVESMQSFLEREEGSGLVGVRVNHWQDLTEGDMVYFDWDMDGFVDHVALITSPGEKPRIAGNTEDAYEKRLTDYPGEKTYYHLLGIRP